MTASLPHSPEALESCSYEVLTLDLGHDDNCISFFCQPLNIVFSPKSDPLTIHLAQDSNVLSLLCF